MKGRVIVLDTLADRGHSAALMVDGRLEDLVMGAPKVHGQPDAGDICVVRVTRKLPKSGAFCEMAGGTKGFLRDAKSIREGDHCLAQVAGLAEPGKAVPLSTRILIKGPRLILTPGAPGVNVSRRIGNEAERERLIKVVTAELESRVSLVGSESGAESIGMIIRTSARCAEAAALTRETDWLIKQYQSCSALLRGGNGVGSGTGGDPVSYALREWILPHPDAILCSPPLAGNLSAYGDRIPGAGIFVDDNLSPLVQVSADPFETAGVHDAMRTLTQSRIPLGPASMIVEATSALVAVDVNTGGDFSPAAGLKANLAAARELPRQLRLRGLGGQIAVDFAPIPKKDRRMLEEALKKAFRDDPVDTALVGWTAMGLYEMQRKRERQPLSQIWTD